MGNDDEPGVTYSLKEILGDINHKLDTALTLIQGKADVSRVEAIDVRLRAVEKSIEHTSANQVTRAHFREWLIPVLMTLVLTVFTILQLIHV